MLRLALLTTLSLAVAATSVGACSGQLALGDHPDAAAPDASAPFVDPGPSSPAGIGDAAQDAKEGGRGLCDVYCTPTPFASVTNATGLACGPDAIYVGTSDGKLIAVPYDTRTKTEYSPAASSAIGYLAYDGGKLFYTLPTLGEVHVRTLATGDDERLAAGEPEPQGVIVTGEDVFFVTTSALRRVARTGTDQVPSLRADWADSGAAPGVGLTMLGTRFLVTRPASDYRTLYSANGTVLQDEPRMFYPAAVTSSPSSTSVVYYASSASTALIMAEDIFGRTTRILAMNQFLPAGVCIHEGRLYFVTESEIRFLDVE
ncbi:MAG: hypothetical protein JWO86_3380 [Myxococcaceae bacterium]|nr:hypothetical protein [Myxococcaceae bacterium]